VRRQLTMTSGADSFPMSRLHETDWSITADQRSAPGRNRICDSRFRKSDEVVGCGRHQASRPSPKASLPAVTSVGSGSSSPNSSPGIDCRTSFVSSAPALRLVPGCERIERRHADGRSAAVRTRWRGTVTQSGCDRLRRRLREWAGRGAWCRSGNCPGTPQRRVEHVRVVLVAGVPRRERPRTPPRRRGRPSAASRR